MAEQVKQRCIAARYELEEPLGRGGMGVVWKATDLRLGRKIALKEVDPPRSLADDERAVVQARVLREARAAARLGHPGAVTVYDVLEEGGTSYIAMELVDAQPLSDVVSEQGPLSPTRAAEVGSSLVDTLEAAHARGIIHRDVKPSNVMIVPDGRIKLADFGIATVKGDPKVTTTGMLLGTPSFMAPEQARGHEAGAETDLWALGATLYFAVEGTPPFDRGQPIATLTAIASEDPPTPTNAGALAPVIERLLAREPQQRPSLSEVRRALQDIIENPGTTAAASPVAPVTTEPTATPVPAPTPAREAREEATPAPAPRRTTTAPGDETRRGKAAWFVAAGLIALVAVAVLALPRVFDRPNEGVDQPAEGEQEAAPAPGPAEVTGEEPPGNWEPYEIPGTGYRISHPPDWTAEEFAIDDSSARFTSPDGTQYLLLDWTTDPGTSAIGAWKSLETTFAAEHDAYERRGLQRVRFQDFDTAALWEYTYVDGTQLHAYNLGFANDDFGFALNFQTHEDVWMGAQQNFEYFKGGFQLAP